MINTHTSFSILFGILLTLSTDLSCPRQPGKIPTPTDTPKKIFSGPSYAEIAKRKIPLAKQDDQTPAALKIQSAARMFLAKKQVRHLRDKPNDLLCKRKQRYLYQNFPCHLSPRGKKPLLDTENKQVL